jgi:hypothetical protein
VSQTEAWMNKAAERLRRAYRDEWNMPSDEDFDTLVDEALAVERAAGWREGWDEAYESGKLAAERRATVLRIKDAMPAWRHDHRADQNEEHGFNSALQIVLAILDEEAAR